MILLVIPFHEKWQQDLINKMAFSLGNDPKFFRIDLLCLDCNYDYVKIVRCVGVTCRSRILIIYLFFFFWSSIDVRLFPLIIKNDVRCEVFSEAFELVIFVRNLLENKFHIICNTGKCYVNYRNHRIF